MNAKIGGYAEYKDSGVAWLGEIPARWGLAPGKVAFREKHHPNTGMKEQTVLSLSYGRVVVKDPEKLHGLVPDSFETYQVLDPGDIVIRGTDLQNDQVSLRVGQAKNRGIITSAYIALETLPAILPEYAYRYLSSCDTTKVFYGLGTGLRQNLSFKDFKNLPTLIPSLDEQAAIVKYLAHVDRKIDRFIRSKRRMIELLNEQKQAIIHQAVTKGLDPSVPMKESGMEWLGEIPAHWSTARLKQVASDIVDCLHATPVYSEDGEYPAIRTADIEPGIVHLDRARRVDRTHYEMWTLRHIPRPGDILYSREGERFGIAASVPAASELCISQRMMVFRIAGSHCGDYFMWQLNAPTVYAQAALDTLGAAAPHVNVETIKNFRLQVPPVHEQRQIAAWIKEQLRHLAHVAQTTKREIELIREYRSRLISDVVTGKINVLDLQSTHRIEEDEFDSIVHSTYLTEDVDDEVPSIKVEVDAE